MGIMSHLFISRFRLGLVTVGVVAGFGIIIWRLFFLHVHDQERLQQIVSNNRSRSEVTYSRRGNIVDVKGNLLAATRSTIEVGVDPQSFDEDDVLKLKDVAALLDMPLAVLRQSCTQKYYPGTKRAVRWKKLAEAVDEGVYERIKALKIKGIYGNRKFERVYPGEELAAHVLGFVNKEGTAVMGVERYMDFYLSGQNGWRESERDGRRREMAQFRHREVEPTDGLNVELTLDQMVQHIIEEELERLMEEYAPMAATIIVSEPATGAILGLANVPSFDPNIFWKFPLAAHRNRAVTDLFEPGSTFKVVPASAALNEGLVEPDDTFDANVESLHYRGRRVSLPRDHHEFGVLSVREIVVQSSNRGAAYLGMLLGADRLYDYAKQFGFGEPAGYHANAEAAGTLHLVKNWDGLTITRLPMGHAVSATPLQVHYALSVIANRGVLMHPQLIRRVFDAEGNTVVTFKPQPRRRVVSTRTAETMTGFLCEVVGGPQGTAPQAHIPGFTIAGKTGTSQKIVEGRYSHGKHIASFAGFFPASRPDLLISVVVDDPECEGVGYGGRVAAPIFRRVAERLIQYKGIHPSNESLVWEGGDFDWLR